MAKVLIIGAGGVGRVATHACSWVPEVFEEICLASRRRESCEVIRKEIDRPVRTAQVDAGRSVELLDLLRRVQPDILINTALPEQNLPIMEACLDAGVDYLDTSAPEPDPRRYELFAYKWQWNFHAKYRRREITAVLSCGFDPGVTNIFCAYASRHLFDEIHTIDILDCNAGSHGHPFATNFNLVTNIQEVIQTGMYYEDGRWVEVEPFSEHVTFPFPVIGSQKVYLIYHEELESLVKFLPGVRRMRFFMGFTDEYLTHLQVLKDLGLTSMEPVDHDGTEVVPLTFLKTLLPDPASLGPRYQGQTCIGCLFEGVKEGKKRRVFLYNVCDHEESYSKARSQAISFTAGVPAMLGALLVLEGSWNEPGVFNVEQLDPIPFLDRVGAYGLPWLKTDFPPSI